MSRPQLSPGTVIDGRFTVGPAVRTREGATVYDGTDAQTGPCSLTIYDASCFPSGLVLERSLRELRQMMSVVSPRVVTVHAAGKWGDGIYEATDRLPPHTLADTLASGPLSLRDAAGLIVQVGEALLEAQRAGVIHRDLGGDVVFPSPDGVKVTGFAVGEPQGPGSFGSLSSIAPEQVEGKVVDQRTLIYNVAALMHWMLVGSPLFAGDRDAVLGQHATGDPPSSVHAKLRRALGKDPRMRPMMLKQFLGELASLGGVEPPRPTVAPIAPTRPPIAASPGAAGGAPSVAAKPPTPVAPTPVAPTAPYGGAPAAPAAKPSSRGWTMFMKAQDDDIGASPEPEPPSKPAPPSAGEVSPSTRGWTMFMKEEDAAQPRDPDATPRPAEAAPPAPDPATGDTPSTRGWTMFMKAQDEEAAAAGADPAAAAPPMPADPGEAKPSTRGWTMFMKEGEEGEAKPQTPAVAPPASAAVVARADVPTAPVSTRPSGPEGPARPPAPEGEASRAAASVATGPSNEPTTRGWTMFMNENQPASEAKPPPTAEPVPAPAPTSAEDTSGPVGPSTRGWTMFSDPAATAAPAPPTATEKGRTEMATAPLSRPKQTQQVEAATTDSGEMAQKKRGWTMFMDAPISDLAQKAPPAPAEAEPEPPAVGASDKKGWTVFGEPSPLAAGASVPEPAPARPDPSSRPSGPDSSSRPSGPDVASVAVKGTEAPERGKTVMYTGTGPAPLAGPTPSTGALGSSPGPSTRTGTAPGPGAADIPPPPPSAAELARAAAEGYAGQVDDRPAKTVIAHGMSTETGAGGSLTGRTTGAGPANQPDTMYFKRGQTEPEKPVSSRAPTARDIEPPASLRPVEERAPRAAGAHPPAEPRAMKTPEPSGGGSKVLYIVLGVVVVGGLATAAFFAFT